MSVETLTCFTAINTYYVQIIFITMTAIVNNKLNVYDTTSLVSFVSTGLKGILPTLARDEYNRIKFSPYPTKE